MCLGRNHDHYLSCFILFLLYILYTRFSISGQNALPPTIMSGVQPIAVAYAIAHPRDGLFPSSAP